MSSLAAFLVLLVLAGHAIAAAPELKTYRVTAGTVSVSGISSGGYMAVQFHVAFSGIVCGAGITAGGPYYCSEGSVFSVTKCQLYPLLISTSRLVYATERAATYGYIDHTSGLSNDRVFLVSGLFDYTVRQGVVRKLEDYYSAFLKSENIRTEFSLPAGHAQITDNYGSICSLSLVPFINNCGYPSASVMLNFIYSGVKSASHTDAISANLLAFDQSEFLGFQANMDHTGYVYVPTACQNEATACRLHIAFHGCLQGRQLIGDVYAKHAGYNAVAEVNNIIVLYPQAVNSFFNPSGCWDWWGYTGGDYAYQSGPQMAAVKRMLDRAAPGGTLHTS